jgi:hypothetical protein
MRQRRDSCSFNGPPKYHLFTVGQSNPCLVPEEQRDMDGQEEIDCSSSAVIKTQ